jgi:hypothetical protein
VSRLRISPQDVAVCRGAKDAGWSTDATKRRVMVKNNTNTLSYSYHHLD